MFNASFGAGDRLGGTNRPELEFVSGKGKRRSPVAVGVVLGDIGQCIHPDLEELSAFPFKLSFALGNFLHDVRQVFAQEDGDDGRGRFVGTEAVIVSGESAGGPQDVGMRIDSLEQRAEEQKELDIFSRGVAGIKKIDPVVG